jgi:hypothetical protein
MLDWYHVSEALAMQTIFIEFRRFWAGLRGWRSVLPHLALLFVFGVLTPRLKGQDFFDPQILGAYACLGLLFAGPATAQLFADPGRVPFQVAKARILLGVVYGEVVVLLLLGASIATVYLSFLGRFVPTPDWGSLARTALFGLCACGLFASMAAWVAVQFSKNAARMLMRLAFFGLLILFFYRGQWLPDVGLTAASGCIVVAGVFIELLRRACR